ncbi:MULTISPECIES: hypothetical protein [Burkholderia]|nr:MULTISPECIES: hypothetical protein [Burkholderia]
MISTTIMGSTPHDDGASIGQATASSDADKTGRPGCRRHSDEH